MKKDFIKSYLKLYAAGNQLTEIDKKLMRKIFLADNSF